MVAFNPAKSSNAFAAAIAANTVSSGALSGDIGGFNIIDSHRPFFAGDIQMRSILPLPAVCVSAITIVPSCAPPKANIFALLLVESIVS